MDGNALAPYFYRGLKDSIKDLLARQEEWRTFEELQDRTSRSDAHLQAKRIERARETRPRTTSPLKMETKPTFNPKPTFIPATLGTPPAAAHPPPIAAYGGPTLMELDSQHRRMSQEEHDRCIRGVLCFTCKEYGHMSRECSRRRVKIAGVEVEPKQEAHRPSENDDAQE